MKKLFVVLVCGEVVFKGTEEKCSSYLRENGLLGFADYGVLPASLFED